jgi:cell wall-associated NlpC family hydrolase
MVDKALDNHFGYARKFKDEPLDAAWKDDGDIADHTLRAPDPQRASALGLNALQRYHTRQRALRSAYVAWQHREGVHYTRGGRRWDGINTLRHAQYGHYPDYVDCSAFLSWCYWDATRIYKMGDFVNGYAWRSGYTGTMTQHGIRVERAKDLLTGDAIFYGGSFSIPSHVAMYVGNGRVISHGSEGGPYLLPYTYRSITQMRRYIR